MRHSREFLRHIGGEFNLPGVFQCAEPYGTGHINDTYHVRWLANQTPHEYIHQRINHFVFKDPARLMDNIGRVTAHLRGKIARRPGAQPEREALTVVPARDGRLFFQDDRGDFWRTYIFITKARTYDICQDERLAREAARAFGQFQADLSDWNEPRLHETIPWFHHAPRRIEALEDAIARDPHNRAAGARPEIDFCLKHKPMTGLLTDLIERGSMPERITHNDTKINNVMIDNDSGRGICVIDLDTVMAGCVLYDFGDMVRSITRTCAEDEPDPDRVGMNLRMFEALVSGYLASAGAFLIPVEIEHLAFSGQLITLIIGIRFLTDYLQGDVYFKTHRPGQNLDRARVQFEMVEHMENSFDQMRRIVGKYC